MREILLHEYTYVCMFVIVCVCMCLHVCVRVGCVLPHVLYLHAHISLGSVSTFDVCVSPFPRAHTCVMACAERGCTCLGRVFPGRGLQGLVAGSVLGSASLSPIRETVHVGGVGGGGPVRATADSQPPPPPISLTPLGFCLSVSP